MSKTFRNIRNTVPYLLPASLLVISGVMLMGLMYYPTPLAYGAGQTSSTEITDQKYWRILADELLASLLADSMRQHRMESQIQVQTQRNHESCPGELTTSLRVAPLIIENSNDPLRPVLIRL